MLSEKPTKLGLGCVTFGREIDKNTSFRLMDYAFEHGIIDFDTAAVYSGGISEEIVGEWLSNHSAKHINVATKIIPPFGYQNTINAVDQSLTRLKTDCIDILYIHRWDESLSQPESWLALEELIFQGKIKEIGVSNFNEIQLTEAVQLLKITSPININYIQNNHNLAVSDISNKMLATCKNEGIEIVSFSPLGAGFLTGKHVNGVAKGSRFDLMPAHQSIYFNEFAKSRLTKLCAIADQTEHLPAFLALSWATHQQNISQVLIGGRNAAQLKLALEASQFFDEEILTALTA